MLRNITALLACVLSLVLTSTINADDADDTRRPNVLLLCIDDLRPELKCFGVDYIHSPSIDRLAASGRAFVRHYVQAPTCGASRYALLTGRYGPPGNDALFRRARKIDSAPASLPTYLRTHGYTTVSVGKVSHHPGGRGGPDWNDDTVLEMPSSWDRHLLPAGPWQHPRGAMHGLAHGEIRVKAGEMDVFQSVEADATAYPDGLITNEALRQLELLAKSAAKRKPFFLAVGIIRPHLPFGAPAKYMVPYENAELPPIPHAEKPTGKTTWHGSGEFMKYNRWKRDPRKDSAFATAVRKHYAACVSYADAQVGRIVAKLHELDLSDDTIILLWGDHGWHLGEHAIWGKHALFEESLRSPLIVKAPQVVDPGQATSSVVETIDLFPTLCDLLSLPLPDHLQGTSLLPHLNDVDATGHPAISYTSRAETIRTERYRLIRHQAKDAEPYFELYDHESDAGETQNVASENESVVKELSGVLDARRGAP